MAPHALAPATFRQAMRRKSGDPRRHRDKLALGRAQTVAMAPSPDGLGVTASPAEIGAGAQAMRSHLLSRKFFEAVVNSAGIRKAIHVWGDACPVLSKRLRNSPSAPENDASLREAAKSCVESSFVQSEVKHDCCRGVPQTCVLAPTENFGSWESIGQALRRKRVRGFTLIEVLMAMVILSVGIVAVHQAFGRCIGAARYSEEKLYCAFMLEKKATELIISSPDRILKDAAAFEDSFASKAGFKFENEVSTVTRGGESFLLHRLRAVGPTGASLEAPLLTPASESAS